MMTNIIYTNKKRTEKGDNMKKTEIIIGTLGSDRFIELLIQDITIYTESYGGKVWVDNVIHYSKNKKKIKHK